MWSWGDNKSGQLGAASEERCVLVPVEVHDNIFQSAVSQLSAGDAHSCACDELGGCYAWGRRREGQCGGGVVSSIPARTPEYIRELAHECVIGVACGADASFALCSSGDVYQWGAVHVPSTDLAHANLSGYGRNVEETSLFVQHMVRGSINAYLGAVPGTDGVGAVVDQASQYGTVGTRRHLQPTPQKLQLPKSPEGGAVTRGTHVSAGFGFAVILLADGGACAFGMNDSFQLGTNDRVPRSLPTRVGALDGIRLVAVACGSQHTLVLDEAGHVYSWGLGSFGQLGHGGRTEEKKPRKIDAFAEAGRGVCIACGQHHSCVVLEPMALASEEASLEAISSSARELYGFGHAEYGQLGTGDTAGHGDAERDYPFPRRIELPLEYGHPLSVNCGALSTIVLSTDGDVLTFGWGSTGALGHGSFGYELQPRRVDGLNGRKVVGITAGAHHALVLESHGGGGLSIGRSLNGLLREAHFADVTLAGGRGSGARRFLAHRVILEARAPRLLAMASLSTRFCSGNGGIHLLEQVKLSGMHRVEGVCDEWDSAARVGSAIRSVLFLHLPRVRAPLLALVLRWVYTGEVCTSETLYIEQLSALGRRWSLEQLVIECDRRQSAAGATAGKPSSVHGTSTASPTKFTSGSCATSSASADTYVTFEVIQPVMTKSDMLRSSLWNVIQYAPFTDVELLCVDGTLEVHACLLATGSDFFRTLLSGGFDRASRELHRVHNVELNDSKESTQAEYEAQHAPSTTSHRQHLFVIDLRLYAISLRHAQQLVQYMYTGRSTSADETAAQQHSKFEEVESYHCNIASSAAAPVPWSRPRVELQPQEAFELLPHASLMLLSGLKRQCELTLSLVVDRANASELLRLAEGCFAEHLKAACERLLDQEKE